MYIRIKHGDNVSEWVSCDREKILSLKECPPQAIIVQVETFYHCSHEVGREIVLSFDVFYALAYEFMKERQRQEICERRCRDNRELEYLEETGHPDLVGGSVADDYDMYLIKLSVHQSLEILDPIMKRRIVMYHFHGYTIQEIARKEGVKKQAVHVSIKRAKKRIKEFLESRMTFGP